MPIRQLIVCTACDKPLQECSVESEQSPNKDFTTKVHVYPCRDCIEASAEKKLKWQLSELAKQILTNDRG